jgi:hypothetical protein
MQNVQENAMRNHRIRFLLTLALATAGLVGPLGGAGAGSFTRGCAARDIQLLRMVEQLESDDAIVTEKLSDAMFAMTGARMVCYAGHVPDALEMYDRISKYIAAATVVSDQRR